MSETKKIKFYSTGYSILKHVTLRMTERTEIV